MATTSIHESRTYGQAILDRLDDQKTAPAALKPHTAAFKKAHTAYDAACERVEAARAKRDAALDVVGDNDDQFDDSANELANEMVGARLGKRQNPFAAFSKYSPGALTALPYAKQPDAARTLVDALKKASAPANVMKSAVKLLKNGNAIEAALAKMTAPQAAYYKAIADREALEQDWSKAMRKLKKHAAAIWDDSPATYKAVFAPASAVQAPKNARSKAKAKKGAKGGQAGGSSSGTTPS